MESCFFELPREIAIGSKNWEIEKEKVASNHTCFMIALFYKNHEGRRQQLRSTIANDKWQICYLLWTKNYRKTPSPELAEYLPRSACS